jgi:hypothetical protein
MTAIKPALALALLALTCKPTPTVDAETTAASSSEAPLTELADAPAADPASSSRATCYAIKLDEAGNPWLWPMPCDGVRWQPPADPVPVTGICCTGPNGPCLAVGLAAECEPPNDYLDCVAGYETVDGNGQPTVICLDNSTGA